MSFDQPDAWRRRAGAVSARPTSSRSGAAHGEVDVAHRLERRADQHLERAGRPASRTPGRSRRSGCRARGVRGRPEGTGDDGQGQQSGLSSRPRTVYCAARIDATHGRRDVCHRHGVSSRASRRSASARAGSSSGGRAGARPAHRRRGSRSIRSGPSRCRITGCSVDHRRRRGLRRITSGSSIAAPATLDAPRGALGHGSRRVSECCAAAPPVLEFDQAGNLVDHWGGPGEGYEWPESNHGITVDCKGIVWIGGNGAPDAHILKFTRDGKFVKQFGKPGRERRQQRPVGFGRVAKIFLDAKSNEAYVADGYVNHRVAVHRPGQRQDQALLGRLRQQADRRQPRPVQSDRAAGAAVPQPGALRRAVERRPRLRLRPRERPRPGVHEGRQVRQGVFVEKNTAATVRCGTSRSRRIRSRSTSSWPTAPTSKIHVFDRETMTSSQLRRRRPPARPVLRRPQHRDRLEGQHLHDGNLRGQARAEVPEQRASRR